MIRAALAMFALALFILLTGCDRPQKAPTPAPTRTVQQTEVDTRCEEDEPCWVCSKDDDRCTSRSF